MQKLDLVVHIVSPANIACATLDIMMAPCPLVDVAMKTKSVCLEIVTPILTRVSLVNSVFLSKKVEEGKVKVGKRREGGREGSKTVLY